MVITSCPGVDILRLLFYMVVGGVTLTTSFLLILIVNRSKSIQK